jgi:hypothetical protein
MVVPTCDAFAPPLTVGVPVARSGGQAVAHAPEHVLFVPESFVNRYSVRPRESTSAFPRRVLATRTLGAWGAADFGAGVAAVVGLLVAAVALPPPPQAATASAVSGISAAPAKRVIGLLRLMFAPLREERSRSAGATKRRQLAIRPFER